MQFIKYKTSNIRCTKIDYVHKYYKLYTGKPLIVINVIQSDSLCPGRDVSGHSLTFISIFIPSACTDQRYREISSIFISRWHFNRWMCWVIFKSSLKISSGWYFGILQIVFKTLTKTYIYTVRGVPQGSILSTSMF